MNINLKYLLLIRVFAIGGQLLALFIMQRLFAIALPWLPVFFVITALAAFTWFSWLRYSGMESVSEDTLCIQLLTDVIALTILIYYTGGSANPFISLFILPIIFAAASMRPGYLTVITLIAVACYTLLMFFHIPIIDQRSHHSGVQLHIWGMWYGFLLSAGLVAYFVSRISRTLRARDQALAQVREEALRAERIVALGTLAAGTAHELGTPLSTMAVLSKEMENEYGGSSGLNQDLRLIREQVDRCKEILARMASDAGELQAGAGRPMGVNQYLTEITSDWRRLRPDIDIRTNWRGAEPVPEIIADRTLTHAIVNVLNNAADASSSCVEMDGTWTEDSLSISIRDDGAGVNGDNSDQAGRHIYSTKPPGQGLGIGLFLAQTTLNRLGGHIDISNRSEGGAHARIEIPLQAILASGP